MTIPLFPDLKYPPAIYRAVGRAVILCKADKDGADFVARMNASSVLPFTLATDDSIGDLNASKEFVKHIDDVMNDTNSAGATFFFDGCQAALDELNLSMADLEYYDDDKSE